MLKRIEFDSGVVKDDTLMSARPRAVDSNRIRWIKKRPQKLAGWQKLLQSQFLGKARAMMTWIDNSGIARIGFGTHKKLYVVESDQIVNVTPYVFSGTLTNPFTTTSGSAVVNVADLAHGLVAGQYVNYSGASAVGGITINGEYTVTAVVDADNYTITHSVTASLSAGPGGGTVTTNYEIPLGLEDTTRGFGYGTGTYGTGTWGTPRTVYVLLPARTWRLDQWGQFMMACPSGGNLYQWQNNIANRAALLSNAPVNNKGFFITEENHVVAYGADGEKMLTKWSDQDNNNQWTPSDLTTAGDRTLTGGSEIRFGMRTRGTNLLLADASVWTMTFVGGQDVFGFVQIAAGSAGIVSPNAGGDTDGVACWMGNGDFFMFDGVLRRIPRSDDIRQFVFDGMTVEQKEKCFWHPRTKHSEWWWFYPADAGLEITRYVKVNFKTWDWDIGLLDHTAGIDVGVFDRPLMASADGYLHEHEIGHDADGQPMNEYVQFSPISIADGGYSMDILALIPDIEGQIGTIEATILTREYPQSPEAEKEIAKIHPRTEKADCHIEGRLASLKFGSSLAGTHWRLGTTLLEIERAGSR